MITFHNQTRILLIKQYTFKLEYDHILNQNLQINKDKKMNKFFKFQQMKKKNKRLFKQEINTLITNIKKDLDTKKQIKLLTLKKKGKFSQDEVDYIMQVVNEYFIQNNLNNQGLKDYIKVKTFRLSKIWLTIAQQIQNQTPTIDKAIGVKIKKQIQSNISNNMEENREKLVNIQNEHYSYLEL